MKQLRALCRATGLGSESAAQGLDRSALSRHRTEFGICRWFFQPIGTQHAGERQGSSRRYYDFRRVQHSDSSREWRCLRSGFSERIRNSRRTGRLGPSLYRRHVDVFELQGCGAGIVYLTAFAAVNVYDLVGVGVGLGLMVGLVVLQL